MFRIRYVGRIIWIKVKLCRIHLNLVDFYYIRWIYSLCIYEGQNNFYLCFFMHINVQFMIEFILNYQLLYKFLQTNVNGTIKSQ